MDTTNPGLVDFLLLFIDFGFTIANGLLAVVIGLIPTVVQLIVNAVFDALNAGG